MTRPLDYQRPPDPPPSRGLALFANVSAAYPLFLLGSLYGQWLLSWWVLGREPQPSLDDPKYIAGASWMHVVTGLALMGLLPAAAAAVALNAVHANRHRLDDRRVDVRLGVGIGLWLGTFAVLYFDPGRVLYWWFD